MKVTFPDKTSLVTILQAVRDFSEYIRFEFQGPLATAILLDSTHVSVTCIECVVSVSELQSGCQAVVHISNFLKVLDLGKLGNEVELDISPGTDIANVSMDGGDVQACLKLFDIEMEEMEPPQMSGTTIDVSSGELMMRMKDMATLGDCVCLRPKKHALELTVDADLGTATVLVKTTTQMEPWDTGMRFALRYLVSILKVSKLFETASVILQPEMPLGLKMKNTHVSLGFYLAPKFNDDEED